MNPAISARRLLRATTEACLATAADNVPHSALVTIATGPELDLILLLSTLSMHTKRLIENDSCSVLCVESGPATFANPQLKPRLSLDCKAERTDDQRLRARFLALHPYAAMYADFADFSIWRLSIQHGLLVEGFGRAFHFTKEQLLPDPAIACAVAAGEAETIRDCNASMADELAAIGKVSSGREGMWRLVAVDPDGCDLWSDQARARASWKAPLMQAGQVRRALSELAGDEAGATCPGI